MGQENKNPEEPGLFDEIKGIAREGFNQARKDVNAGIDTTMRAAHSTIGAVKDGYKTVEDTVGRDRLIGMGIGAKAGALFMATKPHAVIPLFIAQVGIGTVVGGAAGFLFGPTISKRYRHANGSAESNDNAAAPPPAAKPEDPAP